MKKNIFFLGIIAIIPISLSACNSATTAPESTTESVASTVTVTETDANGTEYTYKGTLNDESHLKAMYIPTDATVSQGDTVETSGIGGIYPKGILIGHISRIENTTDLSNRYALVELAVDFSKLETVLVITN